MPSEKGIKKGEVSLGTLSFTLNNFVDARLVAYYGTKSKALSK